MSKETYNKATMVEELERAIARYGTRIAEFQKKLGESPCEAMEWAQDECSTAAKLWASKIVLTQLAHPAKGVSMAEAISGVQETVNRMARFPKHSTSMIANLMEQEKLSALADILDQMMNLCK